MNIAFNVTIGFGTGRALCADPMPYAAAYTTRLITERVLIALKNRGMTPSNKYAATALITGGSFALSSAVLTKLGYV
jgi:hypothetical protein